jgi:hypothetical protein
MLSTPAMAMLVATACGPPTVDVRVLTPLARAARAPAAEAERGVITAERALLDADEAARKAAREIAEADVAVKRADSGQGNVAFAYTDRAYKIQLLTKRELQSVLAQRQLTLARARYELAKAKVADDNSLPEAVDLDLDDFRAEVEDAAAEVDTSARAVDELTKRLAILKKAVHTARVSSLKQAN